MAKNRLLIRRYVGAIVLMLLAGPFVGIGAIRSIDSMRVAPETWAPRHYQSRQTYDWFAQNFETGDVVLISWDGCTLADPRLAKLESLLSAPEGRFTTIVDRIATGPGTLAQLTREPLNLSREAALARLTGSLIGPDGETSCAAITLTKAGNDARDTSIQSLLKVVTEECGVPAERLHVVGPPVNGDAIDRASIEGIRVFSNLSILVCLFLCWYCIRSWLYTLCIIGTGVFGQGVALALVHFLGYRLDAILIVIPSLVLVLTVSAGIHLTNYYRDEVRWRGAEGAAVRALRTGIRPIFLALLTTSIGFGSLAVSPIASVRLFGIVAALGAVVAVGLLLALLVGTFELWPATPVATSVRGVRPSRFLSGIARCAIRTPNLNALVCVLMLLVCGVGATRLTASVDVVSLFQSDSPLASDYRWFESRIGPSVPVEVIVRLPRHKAPPLLQQLQIVDKLQNEVEQAPEFTGSLSAVTFAPPLERGESVRERLVYAAVLNRRLQAARSGFAEANYLAETPTGSAWRISARMTALDNPDYPTALRRLEQRLGTVVAQEYGSTQIELKFTGMMPLVATVQQRILADLFYSFLTACGLVAITLMIALRSVTAGLLSMLPNVFPILLVFGGMGLWGMPMDIGMLMTASVAFGIAVDDTLHFVMWYRGTIGRGTPPNEALSQSVEACGTAMIQTTLICGLGLLVFGVSDFVPTQRFAWTMGVLLVGALAADLILLPALMSGALGRCFADGAIQSAPSRELSNRGPAASPQ